MQRGDRRVERAQRRAVGGGAALRSRARPSGSARESAASISPTARSARRGSCHQCGSSPSGPTRSSRSSTGAAVPALSIAPVEPLVDVAARADDDVGGRQRADVAGPRLVVVRVAVGRQHAVHLGAVARDVAGEVGGLAWWWPRPRRGRRALPRRRTRRSGRRRPPRGSRIGTRIADDATENDSRYHWERMSDWTDHAQRELARAGHRAGGARGEVLELLGRQRCCLSAQEIHDRLRADGPRRRAGQRLPRARRAGPAAPRAPHRRRRRSPASSPPTRAATTTTTRSATAAARRTRSPTPSWSG